MSIETKEALIAAAGYTIQDNGTGFGWYALLPGETEFIHDEANEHHNYLGFFSSKQDLLDEVGNQVISETMAYHDLSDAFWDGLSLAQQQELVRESHPVEVDWRSKLAPGDEVWWNDPDHGKSSGIYKIVHINTDSGKVEIDEDVIALVSEAGSEAEVYAQELSPNQPEDLYPVIDGDDGNGDIYGYARSKEEAIETAAESFVDEVMDAYMAENVPMPDGSLLPKAWVALTHSLDSKPDLRLRLVMDVSYTLNGVDVDEMLHRLTRMVENAIGEGLLTGSTEAEVDEYSMEVKVAPEPLTEDELADFMLQRIENGQIGPEDVPLRLARYGLMDPFDYVTEMRERMETEAEDDEDDLPPGTVIQTEDGYKLTVQEDGSLTDGDLTFNSIADLDTSYTVLS